VLAEHYIPEGCGEMVLDHRSIGSPNTIMNYLTVLDLVLHNGYYTNLAEQIGLKSGTLDSFNTFEKLLDAVKKQISFTHDVLARRHAIEIKVEAENLAHLFVSMLTDDCIEKGKAVMDRGARYLGGIIESFGVTNLADSLYSIKELVYNRNLITLNKLVEILDANFEGYENVRLMMLNLPKFGNDDDNVDSIHTELTRFINQDVSEKGRSAGLDYYLVCNLNPGGVTYANITKASADGRRYGEPMAIGNSPTAGQDKKGLTALLNSMLKHDKHHGGYVHNLKVSKTMFSFDNREKFVSMLNTYFDNGGIQIMVTTLNPVDLKNAMETPEKYSNLLVRVGGWTARFVELQPEYQLEILNRTMYS
jgi:pyruvate-formate lyase